MVKNKISYEAMMKCKKLTDFIKKEKKDKEVKKFGE